MQLKIEKGTFKDYPLEDISDALRKGLSENFKNVEVEVVEPKSKRLGLSIRRNKWKSKNNRCWWRALYA